MIRYKKMQRPFFPSSIVAVFCLSLAYWLYLGLTTHMIIIFDSLNYEALGRLLCDQGWPAYFKTGPNREPLYPLLVSLSMHLEALSGIAYTRVLAFFGVLILGATQILMYSILKKLGVRTGVCALILAYFAISPAINNAAFSLYSEIAAFPIILGILLASTGAWEAISQNNRQRAIIYGILSGALLAAATFVKAGFECITPAYLIIFAATAFLMDKGPRLKRLQKIIPNIFFITAAAGFFYLPITGYKCLNKHYNDNFVITNRGPWALYGSTARRMEPLTVKRFAEALAFAPGEGVCDGLLALRNAISGLSENLMNWVTRKQLN